MRHGALSIGGPHCCWRQSQGVCPILRLSDRSIPWSVENKQRWWLSLIGTRLVLGRDHLILSLQLPAVCDRCPDLPCRSRWTLSSWPRSPSSPASLPTRRPTFWCWVCLMTPSRAVRVRPALCRDRFVAGIGCHTLPPPPQPPHLRHSSLTPRPASLHTLLPPLHALPHCCR